MIRVLIERKCQPGKEKQLRELLQELRMAALRQLGYITGETLRAANDPSLFLVISTWTTADSWKVWQNARQRASVEEMIEPLIIGDRSVRVFTEDYGD